MAGRARSGPGAQDVGALWDQLLASGPRWHLWLLRWNTRTKSARIVGLFDDVVPIHD